MSGMLTQVIQLDQERKWQHQAKCLGATKAFFPPKEDRTPNEDPTTSAAKAVCVGCPVRLECLEHALVRNIRHGVWGGTSERERRQFRRKWVKDGKPNIA